MTIPLGALCSTGRIVEDVRQALFRDHATNNHIRRVQSEQPHGEDAFGFAFADSVLNNCAKRKRYDEAAEKKLLLEAGFKKRAGGVIKHNTNAVKKLAATQAVPSDNVDEGSRPEPPAKKAKQLAKPAAGGLVRGRSGAGARAGGWALGSWGGRQVAVAAAASTREHRVGRRGGPRNRM
eukprot:jgi/Tetstr1/461141/TSEL_006279.t1